MKFVLFTFVPFYLDKTLQDRKTLPREHLIGCQGFKLFLLKDCFKFSKKLSFLNLSFFEFCQNLSWCFVTIYILKFYQIILIYFLNNRTIDFFLVLSQFKFWVLSLLEILRFITFFVLAFYHILSFRAFFAIWVIKFCHNLQQQQEV